MSNLRIAWERHRRGASRAVSSEGRSIARSLDRPAIVNACNRANRTGCCQLRNRPRVRPLDGRTSKELQPEASRLAAGEGTGFRPGGILARGRRGYGLQAGRHPGPRPARVRASGREGRGLRSGAERRSSGRAVTSDGDAGALSRRGCGWCRNNALLGRVWWALATDAAVSSRETRGSYQPGTLRSDAAAIWKYRHSASSYSGSSASSSSAARMCRSHASCAAIPIAKRA